MFTPTVSLSMKRNRASKYDAIYALKVGESYSVPYKPDGSPLPDDPASRIIQTRHAVNNVVPTTLANLRSVLFKHTQATGHKYNLEVHDRPPQPVIVVTRMPDAWEPPKRRVDGRRSAETQRVYEWRQRRDQALLDAWAAFPHRAEVPLSPEHTRLLRQAQLYCRDLAGQANAALRRGEPEFILRKDHLRLVHPDIDVAAKFVAREASKAGGNVVVVDDIRRIVGRTTTVKTLRDREAEARRIATEEAVARAVAASLDGIDAAPEARDEVPHIRRGRGADFDYLWWQDFAWKNPRLHPLQPGERAVVCFMRPPPYNGDAKPRIEDIERYLETARTRWQKLCDEHPEWGMVEAPEYRLVGKFPCHGVDSHLADNRGIERIKRDPESGAVEELVLEWDLSDPYSLPVQSGRFVLARCGRWRGGEWVPVEQHSELHDALRTLKEHRVLVHPHAQYGYGKGVYLLERRVDNVEDLQALRREPAPEDKVTADVDLSDLLGDD